MRRRPTLTTKSLAMGMGFLFVALVSICQTLWVTWLNHHRLLEPTGYIPPAKAEANDYRQFISQTATVAA